LTKGRSFITEK